MLSGASARPANVPEPPPVPSSVVKVSVRSDGQRFKYDEELEPLGYRTAFYDTELRIEVEAPATRPPGR